MRTQPGEKHIVNTGSLAGLFPNEGHTPYSMSKGAINNLTEVIASELKPHGFGVTLLCPGAVRTNLGENTIRISGENPDAAQHNFAPVDQPTIRRLASFALPSADPLGAMVCNAILENTLYVHTNTIPGDMVAERINTWFGPQTMGRS
jgi:NAD(P)-dependent dehydrogenase (short-subunit alcohol dehydrogenase family)